MTNEAHTYIKRTYNLEYLQFLDEFLSEFKQSCLERLNIQTHFKILDAGCGLGVDTMRFAQKANQVYGLDMDQEFLEYAKAKNQTKNIEYVHGNLSKLPFEDDFFDVIYIGRVFQHIPQKDIQQTFSELKRCLKKGGIVFIAETDYESITWKGVETEILEKTFSELNISHINNAKIARSIGLSAANNDFEVIEKRAYPFHIKELNTVERIFKLYNRLSNYPGEIERLKLLTDFYFEFDMLQYILKE